MEIGTIMLIIIAVLVIFFTSIALFNKDVKIIELTQKNKLLNSQLVQEIKAKNHLGVLIDTKNTELHQLRRNTKEHDDLMEPQIEVDLLYDRTLSELTDTITDLTFDRDTWKARAQHVTLPKKPSYQLDENFQIG